MKKITNKLISLILTFSILCLILSSCKIHIIEFGFIPPFPDGYTGGIGPFPDESGIEPYLFETYDELMSAINILKSHGSTFDEGVIVNCEEDEFDVKYVLVLNAHKSDKIIRYGDDPFNRCVKDAYVTNLIFFEEVTVEELAYSHILAYDCYRLFRFYDYDSIIEAKNTPDNIEYRFLSKDYGISYDLIIDGKAFGGFSSFKTEHDDYTELTEVHFKKVLDSIEFIGFDD